MEEWKPIEGYEDIYEVSNFGKVRNKISGREKIFKGRIRSGYYYVALFNNKNEKSMGVHRLVAKAFISNLNNKPCVNHINGNKLDNRVENLEWVTWSENKIHADKKGLSNLKPVKQYTSNGVFLMEYRTMTEAGKTTNTKISKIGECCRKNRKTANGFVWEYATQ